MKRNHVKRIFIGVIFCLPFLFSSCMEDEYTKILTIASMRPIELSMYEWQATYWVKFQGEIEWKYIFEEIRGLDHVKGYEYVVEVKEIFLEGEIPADANSSYYELVRVISKEKKESEGVPDTWINQ